MLVAGDLRRMYIESFEMYEVPEVVLNPLAKIRRMSLHIMFK
jgi:hypothetical protein